MLDPGLEIVEVKLVKNYSLEPFNKLEKISMWVIWNCNATELSTSFFILFSLLFGLLGILIFTGTLIHCFIAEKTEFNEKFTVRSILLCFSIKHNYKLITSKKERNDEISGLDAWRVLSILFVILGHVCMVGINHDPCE